MFKFLLPLLAALAATLTGRAQSVRWEPGSGTLALNQLSELSLVFDQCEPKNDTVTLPAVPGLTINQPPNRSQQTSYNVVNFKATSSKTVTLAYRVRPTERRTLTIPAFQVETDKGLQPVASATFEIGDATVGQSSLALTDIASAKLSPPEKPVWQGQVFDLRYNLVIRGNRPFRPSNNLNWDKDPLVVESWGSPVETQVATTGQPEAVITQSTRAIARAPGTVKLAAAEQDVIIATGQDIFGRATGSNFTITSPSASLTVKPLPAPAPAGFNGAVGQFTLDSKIVPAAAAVGEPITWTLTFDGTGNWPDIAGLPPRSVSKDFRLVQPQAKRAAKGNALFDAAITEDIVLIPTKPGAYTLGPVSISVFNPATGAYETLSTKPVTIQISPAPGQPAPPQPTSTTPPASSDMGHAATAPASAASPIPRDPLPPSDTAVAPASSTTVLGGLLVSVLCPLSLWIALALRRARVTDPARSLREAHSRLTATLRQLASSSIQPSTLSSPLSTSSALQSWQRDTAILWRLPQAVPTPANFVGLDLASSRSDSVAASASEWSALWAEADHTLYGAAPLPADWTARALAALAARPAPAFSSFQLFLPRNLLPLLALALLLVGGRTSVSAAESSGERVQPDQSTAASAYAKTDFPAAEAAWRDALKTEPTDWTAHHNLSLALLQQNHAPEAAGHALAAFVQQPQNPSVRWHLGYAWKTAGISPPSVAQLSTLQSQLAALASPARWQAVLITSAWLGALALSLALLAAYRRRESGLGHSSFVIRHSAFRYLLGAAALLLTLAASVSLQTYGPLADTRAVVVVTPTTLRSIPTDLDTPQKSTPLAIGVIASTDKTFLGWRRLVFPDGQTGWVRTETLVPLWR